jgi:hypothetical protein
MELALSMKGTNKEIQISAIEKQQTLMGKIGHKINNDILLITHPQIIKSGQKK